MAEPVRQVQMHELKEADDPNGSGQKLDMWVVWEWLDGQGIRQFAYCSRQEDAEEICKLLSSTGGARWLSH
jgi:hypothetical protein